ncbi:MAG: hypothetical protein GX774_02430 [Armatimonadetes bacterium]|jgi:hypothetical protein|nr:hypothetical protein [Armatimonadota bacterium]
MPRCCLLLLCLLALAMPARAEVCNLRVVTDASPDYTDLPSMIHSITARWPTDKEKCWAGQRAAHRRHLPPHPPAAGDRPLRAVPRD